MAGKRARSAIDQSFANSTEDRGLPSEPASKKAKVSKNRSLFVRSLPPDATSESLSNFFSEYFPVKHATVVIDQATQQSKGFGFVTFADADDASQAKLALDKKLWDGRHIRLEVAEPRQRDESKNTGEAVSHRPAKEPFEPAPKLIIRNLPWSIKSSDQLGHLFRSFGKVKFADLPQTKGKLKGFGFVTIRGKKNAEKALEAINGKEVDGRTLAVDWAVDKETWAQQANKEVNEDDVTSSEDATSSEGEDSDGEDSDGEDGGAETQLDKDMENFLKNHMSNLDENEVTSDEEDAEGKQHEKAKDRDSRSHNAEHAKPRVTDNSSTVFIRNLPFTTTDDQLKGFFSSFGPVRYARVVMDKISGKPAGTGFVCFFNETDSKDCVKAAPHATTQASSGAAKHSILQDETADPDGRYTLDGRLLQVVQAVGKAEASHLADASSIKRREKDKRRLFLLGEGHIGSTSPLYHLLSQTEIQMRQASAAQRRKVIQSNPSLHLSLTRLAIRNMPRNLGSKELKELARKAIVGFASEVQEGRREPLSKEENARDGKEAKDKEKQRKSKGKGIVRQAKVVFEGTQGGKVTEKSGAGKSRGYGFIEYVSHHYALMGLRYLNGHQLQDDSGKKSRLVVEFAIENAQVVQRRRQQEEKSAQKSQLKAKEVAAAAAAAAASQADIGSEDDAEGDDNDNAKGGKSKANKKLAARQKIIARKRMMRKKKAGARGGE